MRKTIIITGIWLLLLSVIIQTSGSPAAWAGEVNFLYSSVSNNTWAIDKSTRQLILIHYEAPQHTWKSKPVIIPAEFNLNDCDLKAVGIRGTAAFLTDKSSGLITFFDAQDDGTVVEFKVVNIKDELK